MQLLPKEINGVRIIGIDVPGFGVPTHAEAKDVLAGGMLEYARKEAEQGPVQAPRGGKSERPTVTLLGEMFPADPVGIGMMLEPLGLAAGPVVPTREWRELYAALDCRRRCGDPSVLHRVRPRVRLLRAATIVGSAPVGHDGTAAWLESIGMACNVGARQDRCGQEPFLADDPAALGGERRSMGAITLSGYEGSELLVARLLIESGARRALCRHRLSAHALVRCRSANGWKPRAPGCSIARRSSRTSPRSTSSSPTSPSARRRWCRKAKTKAIPALYFTNLISARPLFGVAGAGSLAQVDQRCARQSSRASTR